RAPLVAESDAREPERMLERCTIAPFACAMLENLDGRFVTTLGAEKVRQSEIASGERRIERDAPLKQRLGRFDFRGRSSRWRRELEAREIEQSLGTIEVRFERHPQLVPVALERPSIGLGPRVDRRSEKNAYGLEPDRADFVGYERSREMVHERSVVGIFDDLRERAPHEGARVAREEG